ncbi:MAG TPA: hypothetical protein VMX13_07345 [Sedimentisphaerales bacterium]|nr:hypothetical protein [Sedimentisphaerales bacterium]
MKGKIRWIMTGRLAVAIFSSLLVGTKVHEANAQREAPGPQGEVKSGEKSDGSSRLRNLNADDVKKVEVFRLEQAGGTAERRYIRSALDVRAIKGILALCRKARKYERPAELEPEFANRVMAVELKSGEVLEIPYNSRWHAPFGGLESQELKEALYALTNYSHGTVIHFAEGQVLETIAFDSIQVGEGSHATTRWEASMDLDEQGQLSLHVKLRQARSFRMDDSQPMRYGQAKVFKYDGNGHMIVLLQEPVSYD